MANSTADGSVIIDVDMNVSQAEKRLGKLRGDVKKTEKELADMARARDEAKEKSLFQSAKLDAEKAKLQEIKDRLEKIRSLSKDKGISVDNRETYAANIPAVKQELDEQKFRVRALESEWNKTENSVDSYNRKIDASSKKLDKLKTEAGILTQEIDEATKKQNEFAKAAGAAGEAKGRLSSRIIELVKSAFIFNVISRGLTSLQQMTMKYIQTNDEARQAIAQLKGALLTLAQPLIEVLIPAFTLLVNILTQMISAAAQLVSTLFGKTVQQSKDGAKALYKEANAIGAVGAAADEASGSLAGFDEINTINTESAKGAGGGGASGGEIAPDFGDFGVEGGLLDRLKEIADLVGLIAAGLALWKIGTMLPGVLGQIATALGGILLTVGGLLLFWNGLTDAWENGVDWLNLIEMIGGLAAAAAGLYLVLGPIAAGIALVVGGIAMLLTSFRDAIENGWNLQNVLLSIAGILAAGVGIALFSHSWIPLIIAGIASVLLALTIATGHGEELLNGIQQVIEGFKDFFVGVFTGDMEKAISGISKIFGGLEVAVKAVISGAKDFLLAFLNWIDEKTNGQFHGIIEVAKGFVTGLFETIILAVGNFSDAFEEILTGVVEFFSGVFTLDFEKAGKGLVKIFDGICGLLVTPFVAAINLIIDVLNLLIAGLNKIKFDFPDWVPGMGGKSFGINLPTIPKAKIPRLAKGAVIPPNREFMAVLGDQRSGTNIEAPEELLRKIAREESGVGNESVVMLLEALLEAVKDGHIIMVDGSVFGRTAIRTINNITTATGRQQLKL